MAVGLALAAVLDLFKIPLPHLLYGGSVSLETLPIFVIAFRHGGKTGLKLGGVYGVIDCLLKPHIVHPVQFLLDYPVAFGLLGLVGGTVGRLGEALKEEGELRTRARILAGILGGNGLRFVSHFLSGVVYFAHFAPEGQPVWLYSIIYNASYLIPQTVIHILLLQLILRLINSKPR